jgi:hypothetical protein
MPTMDDPFSKKKPFELGNYRVNRMVLSPKHWKKFSSPTKLAWKGTKFKTSNAKKVPDVKGGVYSFVVQPDIAEHPSCAYLMYVGMTKKQTLRARFNQYFRHQTDTSRRTNISKMLRLWDKHLWFYFASIADLTKIEATEQALLNAYLPPVNDQYKGTVATQLRYLFTP